MTRDVMEKALLLGVVDTKNWNPILRSGFKKDYISPVNRPLFDDVKLMNDSNNYEDVRVVGYRYGLEDEQIDECLSIKDYDGICRALMEEFRRYYIQDGLKDLHDTFGEFYEQPEKYISKIGALYEDLRSIGSAVKSVSLFDNIEEQLTIDENDVIETGFKELDAMLKGWKRGEELVVFMGRTGQGKSWMGLKFAMAAALNGEKVGIYSGEMSKEQLQERILCCAKQNENSTKEEAWQFIQEHNIDIQIITQKELRGRATVDDIENFIVNNNLTMVVVDQLSLMEDNTSKPGTPLRQQYGNISMDLFTQTSKHHLPIILLVQSNRAGGEQKNGPALENIAESDAVAQNATRVISMKNEGGVLTLNLLKNRYGESNKIQKYDVDFAKNRYKPFQETNFQSVQRKPTNQEVFRRKGSF